MGMQFTVKGADFSQNAIGFIPKVGEGLEYLNFFGGSDKSPGRNLAPGKLPVTVVGVPLIGPDSVTFRQTVNYLQTVAADTASKTLMVVSKLGVMAESMLISNYNSLRSVGAAGNTNATSLMYRPLSGIETSHRESLISTTWDGATTGSSTPDQSYLANRPLNSVAALVGRVDAGDNVAGSAKTRKIFNKTAGLSSNVSFDARVADRGQPFRIGSGYTNIGPLSDSEIYFAAIWSRALSDTEIEIMYQSIKAYYTKRGIAI